jgi:hypothetical protein
MIMTVQPVLFLLFVRLYDTDIPYFFILTLLVALVQFALPIFAALSVLVLNRDGYMERRIRKITLYIDLITN